MSTTPSIQNQGLETPVRFLKGVGEARAAQLARLDIETVGDLLLTLPRRYEDRTQFTKISSLKSGDFSTVSGNIMASGWIKPRFGKGFYEVMLGDGSGLVQCRWYGAQYLQDQLHVGDRMVIFGKVSKYKGNWSFQHPEYEHFKEDGASTEDSLHIGRIVPVYPLTEQLPQRVMRRIAWNAVERFVESAGETLPPDVRKQWELVGIHEALRSAHFPENIIDAERAHYRLVFEEFLCMQLLLVARKVSAERFLEGTSHDPAGALRKRFLDSLTFELTGAQEKVLEEIRLDMKKPRPMHRLLQGDVGSGKTVVAVCALLDAIESGSQGAIMAPTEILATQHAQTFAKYLKPLGIPIALLKGQLSAAERKKALESIKSGRTQLIVGTHAMIQEGVEYKRLGLIVIDEQHKFGVEQRGILYGKGNHPDVLVMTATPIPRTLAMTVYGDLDVSIINEMPKGRKEIVTRVIKEEQLPEAYGFIKKQVAKGRQTFLVYPLVSDSEKSDLRSAESMFEALRKSVFTEERLGLVHGQLSSDEKGAVMAQFRSGDIDILVATIVVEVGVDIPNANVMLIENAENFGLSQLHQLRGRIGRGEHKSFCILQGHPKSLDSWKRLKVMEKTLDGFKIAEEDLEIRGMGNLLGKEQSGFPSLRVGNPIKDIQILQQARKAAFAIVDDDPTFKDPKYEALRIRTRNLYKMSGSFVTVG